MCGLQEGCLDVFRRWRQCLVLRDFVLSSVPPPTHLSTHPSIYPSNHPRIQPPMHPPTHPPTHTISISHPSIYPHSTHTPIYVFIYSCLSFHLSIYPLTHPSVHPPTHPIHLVINLNSGKQVFQRSQLATGCFCCQNAVAKFLEVA